MQYNARSSVFAKSFNVYPDIKSNWEAPTGGYLLTACFASGHAAGLGVLAWLAEHAARIGEK